jgi:inner membrane protein
LDNLTHALTGAALAKAGLDRATPLATATLVVAANAPDVDILAFLRGPYFALEFRRGITHGIPALVVLPFAVAGAMLAWDRWVRRRRHPDAPAARPLALLALAFVGLLTHPALDWMNSYGMRWWLPFDGRWSYGDALFIIDPWLIGMLGGAVWLARRRRAPGDAENRPRSPRKATVGFTAAAASYVFVMMVSGALARVEARAAAERAGLDGLDAAMVAPLPGNPLGGEVVIRTSDGYVRGSHRWTRAPRVALEPEALVPLRAATSDLPTAEVEAAIAAALDDPDVRHYLAWSRFPYYRVRAGAAGYRVIVSDVRYDGRDVGSLSGIEVRVDSGRVRHEP